MVNVTNKKTWRKIKLKFLKNSPLVYGANEAGVTDNPEDPRFIRITDIKPDGSLRDDTFKSLPLAMARPFLLKDGDILFARSGATVGKAFIYKKEWGPACFAGYLIRFSADKRKVIPKYIYYFTQSKIYQDYIQESSVQATIQNVSAEKYGNLPVTIPSLSDQKTIVEYLDEQITKLDELIGKKQRLIELLQEKRQALITQVVTKGLNSNVPMKDSGIEWLGEVPAHWTISRLKPFIIINPSKKEISKFSLDMEVTFVPMEAVNESGIVDCSRIKQISECIASYSYFRDGDVLLAKITPCFENGKVALVKGLNNGIGFGSTEFHVLRTKGNIEPRYLAYTVQSDYFRKFGEASMIGAAGQKRVPESFILNFKQAFPPIDEQVEIANFLDREISVIDNIINKLIKQISIIQEYRQALISAAVTGQIDVQNRSAMLADAIPAGRE